MKASRLAAVCFVLLLSLGLVSLTVWAARAAQGEGVVAPAALAVASGSAASAVTQGTIVSITHFTYFSIPMCPSTFDDTIIVADSRPIQNLDIGLNVTHPDRSALRITLTPPDSSVYLLVENSGSFANLDVLLDQESINPPGVPPLAHDPAMPYYDNNWQPLQPLTGLYGQPSQGAWQIHICDTVMTGSGMLNFWTLKLELTQPQAALGTSYIVAPAKVGWAQPITYQVVIKNDDQVTVSDVFLTDPIPSGQSFRNLTCTLGYTCLYDPNPPTIRGFGSILPMSQAVVTFSVMVHDLGLYTNTAIINSPTLTEPVVLQTNSVVVPELYQKWDFELDDGGFIPNDVAEGWAWRDAIYAPAPFHSGPLVWATASSGLYLTNSVSILTRIIDLTSLGAEKGLKLQWWEWADIHPGDDYGLMTINGIEKHYLVGTLPNWTHRQVDISEFAGQVVTLTWTLNGGPDSFTGRGWYLDDISVHSAASGVDLAIIKSDQTDPAQIGQPLTYTVEVFNQGFISATGVVVVDYLPADTVFAGTIPANLGCTYDVVQHLVFCPLGLVPAYGYVPFSIVVIPQPPVPRQAINFISVSSNEPDDNPADNSFSQFTTILGQMPIGPFITDVYPPVGVNIGPITVTLVGGNFQPGARVFLESKTYSLEFSATVVGPDLIEFIVPMGASPGTYDVRVINPDGRTGIRRDSYTIASDLPPVLNTVFPAQALNDTPVVIDIFGDFFYPNDFALTLEGISHVTVTLEDAGFINSHHLRAIVPIGLPVGAYTVTLLSLPTNIPVSLPNAYISLDPATTDDLFSLGRFDFWLYPRAVQAGVTTTLGINLRRMGGQADLSLVPVDFYEGGHLLGRGHASSVPPNSTTPVTITWQAPITPGLYTLLAVLDPDNTVPENDESNNIVTRTLRVLPYNPADLPPEVISFTINNGARTTDQRQVILNTSVSTDTAYMLFIEYRFVQAVHGWRAVANSGWLPVAEMSVDYPWLLTPGAGAHYIQVWAVDGAGNISLMPKIDYINFLPITARLSQGEVHIYRFGLMVGAMLRVRLSSLVGDADFYIWGPDGSLIYAAETGNPVEEFEFTAPFTGRYQLEVEGHIGAEYRLEFLLHPLSALDALLMPFDPNGRPRDQPFTLLPPGGQVGLPEAPESPILHRYIYLPIVMR